MPIPTFLEARNPMITSNMCQLCYIQGTHHLKLQTLHIVDTQHQEQ